MENKMFCYQCQETAGCTGCKMVGVCGKTPDVAYLQDLLIYITKGISEILVRLREEGKEELREVDILVIENLFTTITNVNFNNEDLKDKIEKSLKVKENLLNKLENKEELSKAALISIKREEFLVKVEEAGILFEKDEDKRSLKEMIIYGLKGLAAYLKHGAVLKEIDDNINLFIEKL